MILLFRVRGSLVKTPGGYTVTESFTQSSSKVVQFHTFFFCFKVIGFSWFFFSEAACSLLPDDISDVS